MMRSPVLTSASMSLRELMRNRVVLIVGSLLPAISFAIATLTTTGRDVTVRLAQAPPDMLTQASERTCALLFLAVAAVGVISAFLGASLIQRRTSVNRRLILCGFRAGELITAKLLVLVLAMTGTSLYTMLMLVPLATPVRPPGVLLGLLLAAYVYGAYGLLVGSIFRRDLEAIFAIVLLINIDAGWLQNPVYYLTTPEPWIVESLPGHHPAQTTLLAALTSHQIGGVAVRAFLYGSVLLLMALAVYSWRMRIRR